MAARSKGITTCGGCRFWRAGAGTAGTCRRNAPASGNSPAEVAHWPETDRLDMCGEGIPAAAFAGQMVVCRHCLYWHETSAGQGLSPVNRRDHIKEWWLQAGYCVRHAPVPLAEPGCHGFWRVTHATDGCAEGVVSTP